MQRIKFLTRAGIIASLYIVLSIISYPVSSGAIQVRLGEGLCLLPLLFLEAVPALAVGCAVVNLITGCALIDIILGSLITLVAGAVTYFSGKLIKNKRLKICVGGIFPVLLNALILPLVWLAYSPSLIYAYPAQALLILAGQLVSVYALGVPIYFAGAKIKFEIDK